MHTLFLPVSLITLVFFFEVFFNSFGNAAPAPAPHPEPAAVLGKPDFVQFDKENGIDNEDVLDTKGRKGLEEDYAPKRVKKVKKIEDNDKGQGQGHRHIKKIPIIQELDKEDKDYVPSGLTADNKPSESISVDETLSSQRRFFLALLAEHRRHPKKKKKVVDEKERYIILYRDPSKPKGYAITEESSEEG